MLRTTKGLRLLLALALAPGSALAQVSGSDGSYGPIDVQTGTETIQLPPDGIIHATTVNVALGATLNFAKNALDTPVHLLATGDIVVAGTIDVSGQAGTANGGGAGGPGGFAGGAPGITGLAPGAGQGPGAGLGGLARNTSAVDDERAGLAAYGGVPNADAASNGSVYGSPLLVPLAGGSGGGGAGPTDSTVGGGGGGGAILLASDTAVAVTGGVQAVGGFASSNGNGSGGAIRIVAPVVTGTGILNVSGGLFQQTAGHGRIRVDTIDLAAVNLSFNPTSAASLGSFLVGIPPGLPRLDIVKVAGEDVPEGTTSSVSVILPFGTANDQTLTVRASDFSGIVPIRVVITPQTGAPIVTDHEIDMTAGSPQELTVDLDLPQNVLVNILVFTRDA